MGWDKGLGRHIPFAKGRADSQTLANITSQIDYRVVLLGSMLPDIIDKPIGHIFLADTFHNNGRLFAHTLLFFSVLFFFGLYRYLRSAKIGFLALALGSGFHLILDSMWNDTQTFFWPIHGWNFPQADYENWLEWIKTMHEGVQTDPAIYIAEVVGLLILVPVGLRLLQNKQVIHFLKTGAI